MNDWNSLETNLRAWKPRPPSASLKRRIFPELAVAGEAAAQPMRLTDVIRWMVPALGCLLLVISSLSTRLPYAHLQGFGATNLALSLVGQESPAEMAFLPQSRGGCEQNTIPVKTLELRFAPATLPAEAATRPTTNALIQ